MNTANILLNRTLTGNRIAIITHAGGPSVMLADTLARGGFNIAPPKPLEALQLKDKLFLGSSVENPFDFLATGTSTQLDQILDFCENDTNDYDAIITIFGSPGLTSITDALEVIKKHQNTHTKPIFAILPSVINSETEIKEFIRDGYPIFFDEVEFGNSLNTVYSNFKNIYKHTTSIKTPSNVSTNSCNLPWDNVVNILSTYKIPTAKQWLVSTANEIDQIVEKITFPLVAKVCGINHKSDVGGVIVNIDNLFQLQDAFKNLMELPNAIGVIIQEMLKGIELFIGAKYEPNYGHLISCGLGGIYIEVFKDITTELNPVNTEKALEMIESLKCIQIFDGIRGNDSIDKNEFATIIKAVSDLLIDNPLILELDINPLIATKNGIFAVDGRITKQNV